MIPLRKYQEATTRVLEVYRARTADAAYVLGVDAGIDYLLITPLERRVEAQTTAPQKQE